MPDKLKYHPVTNKKLKPIVKFNGGRGALLCNTCKIIIKENLTVEEFAGKTNLLFCHACALEAVIKRFKT
jgi:hypothetical protein